MLNGIGLPYSKLRYAYIDLLTILTSCISYFNVILDIFMKHYPLKVSRCVKKSMELISIIPLSKSIINTPKYIHLLKIDRELSVLILSRYNVQYKDEDPVVDQNPNPINEKGSATCKVFLQ
jgi:hypothetical protein